MVKFKTNAKKKLAKARNNIERKIIHETRKHIERKRKWRQAARKKKQNSTSVTA